MSGILPQIKHIIVVMLANRSFDNMCGWLYKPGTPPQPSQFLPQSSPHQFEGLKSSYFNPVDEDYFYGHSTDTYPIFDRANSTKIPDPEPQANFENVNYQLFGPGVPSPSPKWPNLGFVINYAKTSVTNIPVQIMEPFSPAQVPVISALATNYAISDAWFCSVPSQAWPNRAFFHAGTSHGNVNDGTFPNPFAWNVRNIFNVLEDIGATWCVYSDSLLPCLTWLMFPNLWADRDHFSNFDTFKSGCASGALPQYTFLEPSFLDNANDQHPPNDVIAGEHFLYDIWQTVIQSPAWPEMLLMITYDEHGGTYDHVQPPFGAVCPDERSDPGEKGFTFNRFGVRVPTILISPWIQAGTVFRSPTATPYDHTSLLATLRDWLQIPADKMLTSARIARAPTFEQVLTLPRARTDLPVIPHPVGKAKGTVGHKALNALQKSLVSAYAVNRGQDPAVVLGTIRTRQDAINYFFSNATAAEKTAMSRMLEEEPAARKRSPIKSIKSTFDTWDAGLLIVNGEIWEDTKVEDRGGARTGIFHGSSVSKLAELSFQDLAGYFYEFEVWIPDAGEHLNGWVFGRVEASLHSADSDHIEIVYSLGYDLELWSKPYSIADLATAIQKTIDAHDTPFAYWQRDQDSAIEGLGVSISMSLGNTVGDALSKQEELAQLSAHIRAQLGEGSDRAVNLVFDFPPAIKTACEQYLLYFVQFLSDLGIDATAEIKEQARDVLFSVTPTDEKQALEQIREALRLYLGLPVAPEFGIAASQFRDIAVSQLQANVLHLQSQVVLAKAAIDMKNATIEAREAQLALLQDRIDLLAFQPQIQGKAPESEREELVRDIVSVKKLDYKFLEINVPEILRKLKRRLK